MIPERCVEGAPRLSAEEAEAMAAALHPGWDRDGEALVRRVRLDDFGAALEALNAIGAVAEEQNHHPDLGIADYRDLTVRLSTHDAAGLTANDFVVALRVDRILDGDYFQSGSMSSDS